MRKSKNVFIIVLTFVLVCVIGYALFSNQLTINGTVSAKGEFEFTATCEPVYQVKHLKTWKKL